ncbi:TPA: ATP/GTP-binding protein [Streptococcus suis]
MIKSFKVKGFRNFKNELHFNLTAGNYEYNLEGVENGIIKNSLIYGDNASGKTNLGLALMDIVSHLTDKHIRNEEYDRHYLNLDSNEASAEFEYVFRFGQDELKYTYKKIGFRKLVEEKLLINNEVIIDADLDTDNIIVNLQGTENLIFDFSISDLSIVKYIRSNSALKSETDINSKLFLKMMKFVNNMLSFDSLDGNRYRGYKNGAENIASAIIESGNLENYNSFLRELGIDYDLIEKDVDGEKRIYAKFSSGKTADFQGLMSKGTRSLTLFFYWYLSFEKGVQFVFMDEFDAYFHNDVSRKVIKKLIENPNIQTIITSHNTTNMSNNLLRPDCYYIIDSNEISNLTNRTDMIIRKTQNIEKMYRTGFFNNG